jgi:Uncharacterized protein conserved in bacteria (DUF2314)
MSNKKQTPFSMANVPNWKKQSAFRYELGDGEKSHLESPDTFSIPSREERENLVPGMIAKLTFHIYDGNEECGERMWVTVEDKQPDHYIGTLINNPISTMKLRMGDKVIFKPENVIDIVGTENSLSKENRTERYLAIGLALIHLMDEVNVEDWICDDCLKAMKEEEAAQAAMNVKH